MAVWDSMSLGGAILPITAYDESNGIYEDFSGGLAGLFGTSPTRESTDGKLKNGFYAQGTNVYWGDSQHQSHSAINNEHEFYRNPYGNDPDPTGNYSISNGNLIAAARVATPAEQASFAHYKGYHIMPDGQQETIADNGSPNASWFPVRENRSGGAMNDSLDVWRYEKYPADFISYMFSSLGRKACSFPRIAARAKCSSGGEVNSAAGVRDYQQINAWFAAIIWALEYIEYGKDINGDDLTGLATHMPANDAASGVIPELDAHENFSGNPGNCHHTMHYYNGTGARQQTPSQIIPTPNQTNNFNTFGVDVTPGKIGFWINDVYTYVIATPSTIANPKPRYQIDPNNIYRPLLGSNGIALTDGTRENSDGTDYYMKWFFLSNLAVNSNLVKGTVYDSLRNPDQYFTSQVAAWNPAGQVEIEYMQMYPLAVDNPDQYPTEDKGVSIKFDGGTGTPTVPVVTSPVVTRPLTRENFTINHQDSGIKSNSFIATAVIPAGKTPDEYTYVWSVSAGLEIGGVTDQYTATMSYTNAIAEGAVEVHTINCDISEI